MRRTLIAGLFWLACGSAVYAAAYDDFARGVSANNQGDADLAIKSFTAALAAGDLSANLQPVAHYGLGVAHLRKGKCGEALADANDALAARSNYADALAIRASADSCLRNLDAALADFTSLIALQPGAEAYRGRGTLRWRSGDFSGAAEDFAAGMKLARTNAYLVLWFAVSMARAGTLDIARIRDGMDHVDDDDWPGPVIALYTGRATPEKVQAAAAKEDKPTGPICEADFYIAEWSLAHSDVEKAKPLLEKAAQECPHDYLEYGGAQLELERMK